MEFVEVDVGLAALFRRDPAKERLDGKRELRGGEWEGVKEAKDEQVGCGRG